MKKFIIILVALGFMSCASQKGLHTNIGPDKYNHYLKAVESRKS